MNRVGGVFYFGELGTMFRRQLPDILREHERDLEAALGKPLLESWRERDAFAVAEQPGAIAVVLIDAIYHELKKFEVACVYRKAMAKRDKVILAKASLAGSKLEYFCGLDCIIEVNWEAWPHLSVEQRIALMDHELRHFEVVIDEKKGEMVKLKSHDVEEFECIIRRWGLWKPDLHAFAATAADAHQRSLFEARVEADATR